MPHHTNPEDSRSGAADGRSDLRRRKRIRTKQMVQREALRLFAEKGYEQTTVDDIAHTVAMSPRTFFRYFPSKEDVVLWDEYDDLPMREVLQIRPGEDPFAQLIRRIREIMADVYHKDPELLLNRTKLSFAVPEIRARFLNAQLGLIGPYLEQLAEAVGTPPSDLRLAVTLAALYSAMLVATERWQRDDGRADLLSVLDEAIAALAETAMDLRDTVRVAAAADARPTGPEATTAEPTA